MKTRTIGAVVAVALGLAAASAVAATPPESPMMGFVGLGINHEADFAAYSREETIRQEAIAVCMAARGFAYTATSADFNVLAPSEEAPVYYGLVTPLDPNRGLDTRASLEPNPNIEYAEKLGEVERAAFLEALFGSNWESENQAPSDYLLSCTGAAYAATPGVAARAAALRASYRQQRAAAIATDPSVVAATSDWSECMFRSGFAVETPASLLGQIDAAVIESQGASGVLTPEAYSSLIELERRAYAADSECGGDLRAATRAAIIAFDTGFAARNASALEPFRADSVSESAP